MEKCGAGAFWQCRRDIGSDVVDKILFSAWKEAAPPNDAADLLRSFARKVVDLASKQDARSAELCLLRNSGGAICPVGGVSAAMRCIRR